MCVCVNEIRLFVLSFSFPFRFSFVNIKYWWFSTRLLTFFPTSSFFSLVVALFLWHSFSFILIFACNNISFIRFYCSRTKHISANVCECAYVSMFVYASASVYFSLLLFTPSDLTLFNFSGTYTTLMCALFVIRFSIFRRDYFSFTVYSICLSFCLHVTMHMYTLETKINLGEWRSKILKIRITANFWKSHRYRVSQTYRYNIE